MLHALMNELSIPRLKICTPVRVLLRRILRAYWTWLVPRIPMAENLMYIVKVLQLTNLTSTFFYFQTLISYNRYSLTTEDAIHTDRSCPADVRSRGRYLVNSQFRSQHIHKHELMRTLLTLVFVRSVVNEAVKTSNVQPVINLGQGFLWVRIMSRIRCTLQHKLE